MGRSYLGLRHDVRDLDLVTVCEEAGCPNIYECWSDGTATFMINGADCTRACGFCQVGTARPRPLDPDEPIRVAEAVARLGLAHAVITCVARDDLPDGGASAFAEAIAAIRRRTPDTTVEVLIADCKGDGPSLATVFEARPDVLNHNIETVARLQRAVRPSAGYGRSLGGAGPSQGCRSHHQVRHHPGDGGADGRGSRHPRRPAGSGDRHRHRGPVHPAQPTSSAGGPLVDPEEFEAVGTAGMAMGFSHVQSSPLTRSSYHARQAAEAAVRSPMIRRSHRQAGPKRWRWP